MSAFRRSGISSCYICLRSALRLVLRSSLSALRRLLTFVPILAVHPFRVLQSSLLTGMVTVLWAVGAAGPSPIPFHRPPGCRSCCRDRALFDRHEPAPLARPQTSSVKFALSHGPQRRPKLLAAWPRFTATRPARTLSMLEVLTDPHVWASFIALSAMEIVLGIDNVVFISVMVRACRRISG